MKGKVENKISTYIDLHTAQGKIIGGIIMGILGAVFGGVTAGILFRVGESNMHSPALIVVVGSLLFLLFIDKVFL